MNWIKENLPAENFDFNGDGSIDSDDVNSLFDMVECDRCPVEKLPFDFHEYVKIF